MNNPFRPAPFESLEACLVVEDDSIIRLDLEETLRGFGMQRVHGASTLEAAVKLASSSEIRFAVLDFELGRTNTLPVAEALVARGVPAVFLTAHGSEVDLPPALSHIPVLSKPFSPELLAKTMLKQVETVAAAKRGFAAGLLED